MPVTFRSNAWFEDRDNKLKPKVVSASSASGGARNPLPSWTVSPFSATAASKLVNTTSPFSNPWITGTAAGAVARISDRIIDCPAKVIVIGADCGRCAEPTVHRIANKTARPAALVKNRPVLNIVAICVAPSFSSERSMYSRFCLVSNRQTDLRRINILGFGEDLPVLEGLGPKRKILGE